MNYKILANTAMYYKEDKEGMQAMCKVMEDMITDEKKEAAVRMLESGKLTNGEIARFLDLSFEIVAELANNLQLN